jgi:hypothetical protein
MGRRRPDGCTIALGEQPFPRRAAAIVAKVVNELCDLLARVSIAEPADFTHAIALVLTDPTEVQWHWPLI